MYNIFFSLHIEPVIIKQHYPLDSSFGIISGKDSFISNSYMPYIWYTYDFLWFTYDIIYAPRINVIANQDGYATSKTLLYKEKEDVDWPQDKTISSQFWCLFSLDPPRLYPKFLTIPTNQPNNEQKKHTKFYNANKHNIIFFPFVRKLW